MKLSRPNTLSKSDLQATLRDPKKKIICWNCSHHPATDVHHLDKNHRNDTPSNLVPWCKRCHNEHHGISDNLTELGLLVRQYDAIQVQRIAMNNRVIQYEKLGYDATVARHVLDGLRNLEAELLKEISSRLKLEPIYKYYLSKIKGIGPAISAQLITRIGDPARFDRISSLWKYCGLDVRDGEAPRRRKGTVANWNHHLRMVLVGRMIPQFIKLKGKKCFGRDLYDQYKTFYTNRDKDAISAGHIENRARRKVAKVFLSCLWVAWRRIKGLSITEPYAMSHLGHTHLVTPEEWAGDDWFSKVQVTLFESLEV